MSFCKYRDAPKYGRKWCKYGCKYGCTTVVTVCHKWAKKRCKYQGWSRCHFGVHAEPPGAFGGFKQDEAEDEGPARKKQRTNKESETVQHMIDLIKTDPVLAGSSQDAKDMYLKRMLRALHPDKVNGTPLESLFDSITKEIVKMRESV